MKKISPKSLANLNPRNRYQGKERFNTTLLPETIAWLQQSGNASQKIEELVLQAKSENAHELKLADISGNAYELKLVKEKLSAVADVVGRWESEAGSHKTSSPRWEKVIKLLSELRIALSTAP